MKTLFNILPTLLVSTVAIVSINAKAETNTMLLAKVSLSVMGDNGTAKRSISFNSDGTVAYNPGGRTGAADVPVSKVEDKRGAGGSLLISLGDGFGSIEITNPDHSGSPHFFFTDSSRKKIEMVQSVSYQAVEVDSGN